MDSCDWTSCVLLVDDCGQRAVHGCNYNHSSLNQSLILSQKIYGNVWNKTVVIFLNLVFAAVSYSNSKAKRRRDV